MSANQFISVREAAQLLGTSEKKIMDLIEGKKLLAYRIAEKFLRLKKSEVLEIRHSLNIKKEGEEYPYTAGERLKDFLYYNDFYLVSCGMILVLVYIIFYM